VRAWVSSHPKISAAVLLVVLFSVFFPLAYKLDAANDRPSQLYENVEDVAKLQMDALRAGESIEEIHAEAGSTVAIGGEKFTLAPGIRLDLEAHGMRFCIRGWNKYDDATGWLCGNKAKFPL
jgi:hypothetical protein